MTDEDIELLAYEAMQREDFGLAAQLFATLENKDSGYALISLGWMHENGYLGIQDKKAARTYYERAMAKGDAGAHFQMALLLANDGKLVESRNTISRGMGINDKEFSEKLANLNSVVLDKLAHICMERNNYKEAFSILKLQVSPESEYTLSTLGWLYQSGLTEKKDIDLARSYFKRASELGSVDVNFQIGMLELSEKNMEAARAAFDEGARLGHLPSISRLGKMMIDGQGGPIESEKGAMLLESCAAKGHILSKIRLLRIDIDHTDGYLKKMIKKSKYVVIGFDMMRQIIKRSDPSNYYEFR